MKKILALGLVAAFALTSSIFACGEEKTSGTTASKSCSDSKSGQLTSAPTTDAKMVGDKAACAAGANAKMAGDKAACAANMAACGTDACCDGMTMAKYIKDTKYEGKMAVVNMSIKGMTCNGCAEGVSATLAKVDGVLKVVGVDYKAGTAKVLVSAEKVKNENLVTAVTAKSYEAKLIMANADAKAACCSVEDCLAKLNKAETKTEETKSAH